MLTGPRPAVPGSSEVASMSSLIPFGAAAMRALAVVGITLVPCAALLAATALRWLR